jgi:hypothetical protein
VGPPNYQNQNCIGDLHPYDVQENQNLHEVYTLEKSQQSLKMSNPQKQGRNFVGAK